MSNGGELQYAVRASLSESQTPFSTASNSRFYLQMTIVGCCHPVREARERATERCSQLIPCLSDPGRRQTSVLKLALVVLHVIFVGVLFLFDSGLREKTLREPWYTAIYLLLLVGTIVQYFITSATSPGYVIDAMRAWNETHATLSKTSRASEKDNLLQAKMEA